MDPGHLSVAMLKLSSVAVVVSDAKKSAKWYHDKLGFQIRDQEGHWITVGPKGASIDIHLCAGDALEPGNTGFGFVSKDVAKEQKELEAKGVKFTVPTKHESWGTYAMFADPDGNEFWINEV
ncbi:MAG TPA: VOC family protein [Thermoplasmata archaeon]|nr:VOC family protein [Thermoplasmata archaeon]